MCVHLLIGAQKWVAAALVLHHRAVWLSLLLGAGVNDCSQ
jgi:hypothetical protein